MILVFFYIFAFLSVSLRLVNTLTNWCPGPLLAYVVEDTYLIAKLCVGMIQAWTTLEMILRIRQIFKSDGTQESYDRYDKRIKFGQYFFIIFTALVFVVYTTQDTIRSLQPHQENWYVYPVYAGMGYSYLAMFILTLVVNIFLFREIEASKKA